eukprot:4167046-Pyramimonas_sp.AAC.1
MIEYHVPGCPSGFNMSSGAPQRTSPHPHVTVARDLKTTLDRNIGCLPVAFVLRLLEYYSTSRNALTVRRSRPIQMQNGP